jgi:hypothetical protein
MDIKKIIKLYFALILFHNIYLSVYITPDQQQTVPLSQNMKQAKKLINLLINLPYYMMYSKENNYNIAYADLVNRKDPQTNHNKKT